MKLNIICSIPMRGDAALVEYKSEDASIVVSDRSVMYPISSYLDKNLVDQCELKVILLVKNATFSKGHANIEVFKKELNTAIGTNNITVDYHIIETDFCQDQAVHEYVLEKIIEEIEPKAPIIADITYGPKDIPIVMFTAMTFAEKFLSCDIEKILYGQVEFDEHNVVNCKICDMTPLFYLSFTVHSVEESDPSKAKRLLKSLLIL